MNTIQETLYLPPESRGSIHVYSDVKGEKTLGGLKGTSLPMRPADRTFRSEKGGVLRVAQSIDGGPWAPGVKDLLTPINTADTSKVPLLWSLRIACDDCVTGRLPNECGAKECRAGQCAETVYADAYTVSGCADPAHCGVFRKVNASW